MKILFYEVQSGDEEFIQDKLKDHSLIFNPDILLDAKTDPDSKILSIRSHSKVTKAFLDKPPKLKLIVTRTTGFDHCQMPILLRHYSVTGFA